MTGTEGMRGDETSTVIAAGRGVYARPAVL